MGIKLGTRVRMAQTMNCFAKYLKKGIRSIDIGAGNGYISEHLKYNYGCEMHCADVIDYMEMKLPYTKIVDNKLPFKDKAFDIAIMNDVLHHMQSDIQIKMLKESVRIAKKVLIVETQRTFLAMFLDHFTSRVQCWNMHIPCTHHTRKQWEEVFPKLGMDFEETKVNHSRYYPIEHLFFAVWERRKK